MHKITILTNCTHRKRKPPSPQLVADSLPVGGYDFLGDEWVSRLKAVPQNYQADQLYCGRSVTETLKASEYLNADVFFVSAGLGVIHRSKKIPSYNLTASVGYECSISKKIDQHYDSGRWWASLIKSLGVSYSLSHFLKNNNSSIVLLVLPASYLSMVANELEILPREVLSSIRIIGPRNESEVPMNLRAFWIPYDGRLDNPKSGFSGTLSDFPQRALHHFAKQVLSKNLSGTINDHIDEMHASLLPYSEYIRSRGRKATDEVLISEIKGLWKKYNGKRVDILRDLRSVKKIACEQSRFKKLADQVKEGLRSE